MAIKKKPLLIAASGVAGMSGVAALVAGTTFGLFSAQSPSVRDVFTSGNVTFSEKSFGPCTVTDVLPGQHATGGGSTTGKGARFCEVAIRNRSTVGAYAALDVFIATGAASPSVSASASAPTVPAPLYDPATPTNSLTFTIRNSTGTSFTVPVTANAISCTSITGTSPFYSAVTSLRSPAATSCYEVDDLLLSTSPIAPTFPLGSTVFSSLSVGWSLSATAANVGGGDAVIAFSTQAVQAGGNVLTCTGGSPAVGVTCIPAGAFHWS